jgi:hypothetical protein
LDKKKAPSRRNPNIAILGALIMYFAAAGLTGEFGCGKVPKAAFIRRLESIHRDTFSSSWAENGPLIQHPVEK